jgi:alcohol dehydrogenase class IV
MSANTFRFEYEPATIHHGPKVVRSLNSELERRNRSRALVVSDSTLTSVSAVMDPIREGLGDNLEAVFAEITPKKYLKTAYDGAKQVREKEIDVLVPVGGGSSLDTAKIISVLAGHDRPLDDVTNEIVSREEMVLPDNDRTLTDIFAIPTTLPGADLSQVAGVKLTMEPKNTPVSEIPSGGVGDRRLMPAAVFHDVELFSTTPDHILARSAMNGFDKGIEMLYCKNQTPVTDAAAMRGLRLLQSGLPTITDDSTERDELSKVLRGIALVQYGLSTPQAYRVSVIHAFGHALARQYPIQQGVAHAIAAPNVLRYLFENVHGRRDLLAEALGVKEDTASKEETAEAVVRAVKNTRDTLELPSRLRSIDEIKKSHFPRLAEAVVNDAFMPNAPRELEPDLTEIEAVFENMW